VNAIDCAKLGFPGYLDARALLMASRALLAATAEKVILARSADVIE
jgi:hypothetical protein